jgi:hypothetical protein
MNQKRGSGRPLLHGRTKKTIIARIMADFDKVYRRILHGVWTPVEI